MAVDNSVDQTTDEERDYYDQLALAIANRDIKAEPVKGGGWKFLRPKPITPEPEPPQPPTGQPDTSDNEDLRPGNWLEAPTYNQYENYQEPGVQLNDAPSPDRQPMIPDVPRSQASPWPSYNAKEVPNPDNSTQWQSDQERMLVNPQDDGKVYTAAGKEDQRATPGSLRAKLNNESPPNQQGVVETTPHNEDTSSPFKLGWRAYNSRNPLSDTMENTVAPAVGKVGETASRVFPSPIAPIDLAARGLRNVSGVNIPVPSELIGSLASTMVPVTNGDFALEAVPGLSDVGDIMNLGRKVLGKELKPAVKAASKAADAIKLIEDRKRFSEMTNWMYRTVPNWVADQDGVLKSFFKGEDLVQTNVVRFAVKDGAAQAAEEGLEASRGAVRVTDPSGIRVLGPDEPLQEGESLFFHGGRINGDVHPGTYLTPDIDVAKGYAGVTERLNALDKPKSRIRQIMDNVGSALKGGADTGAERGSLIGKPMLGVPEEEVIKRRAEELVKSDGLTYDIAKQTAQREWATELEDAVNPKFTQQFQPKPDPDGIPIMEKAGEGKYGDNVDKGLEAGDKLTPDVIHTNLKNEAAERLDYLDQLRQSGASPDDIFEAERQSLESQTNLLRFYDDTVEYMNAGFNPLPVVHQALKQSLALAESVIRLPDLGRIGAGSYGLQSGVRSAPNTVHLLGWNPVNPHLSIVEHAANRLRDTIHTTERLIGPLAHPLATPVVREYKRAMQRVKDLAKVNANQLEYVIRKAFPVDEGGHMIIDGPLQGWTVADVFDRRRSFTTLLSPEQESAFDKIQQATGPFYRAQQEQGIDIKMRDSIEPGGGYLPRGRKSEDDLDYDHLLVRPSRSSSKIQQQLKIRYPTQAEGINAGVEYISMGEALEAYFRDAGRQVLDAHVANIFKNATDETGQLLSSDRAARLLEQNGPLKDKVEELRNMAKSLISSTDDMDEELHSILMDFINNPAPDLDATRLAFNNTFIVGGPKGGSLHYDPMNQRVNFFRGATKPLSDAVDKMARGVTDLWTKSGKPHYSTEHDAFEKLLKSVADHDTDIDALRYNLKALFNPDGSLRKLARHGGQNIKITEEEMKTGVRELVTSGTGLRRLQATLDIVQDMANLIPAEKAADLKSVKDIQQAKNIVQKVQDALSQYDDFNVGWSQEDAAIKSSLDDLYKGLRDEVFVNDPTGKWKARGITTREQKLKALLQDRVSNVGVKRGQFTGLNYEDAKNNLAFVKTQLDGLLPRWKQALDDSKLVPPGYMSIDARGVGTNLRGVDFPEVMGSVINKSIQDSKFDAGAWTSTNNFLRGFRSTGDISYAANQGLLTAYDNPKNWWKGMMASFNAFKGENGRLGMGKFLDDFNNQATSKGMPIAQDWIQAGGHFGGSESEYQMGVNPLRPFDRAFGAFGDVVRLGGMQRDLELAIEHGLPTDRSFREVMQGIAAAHNGMTGWSPNKFGGAVGDVLLFAPRFYQAQFENILRLASSNPEKRDIARRSLLKMVAFGSAVTMAANTAAGNPPGTGDFDWWSPTVNGKMNPNFMRVRAGGVDLSVFGYVDSLLSGMVGAVSGDPAFIARSKANPLISTAIDLILGKNVIGDNTNIKEGEGRLNIIKSFLPFSVQKVGQESALKSAIGPTGAKASDVTVTEKYQQLEKDTMRELATDGTVPKEVVDAFKQGDLTGLSSEEKKLVDRRIGEKHPDQLEGYKQYRRDRDSIFQSVSDQADSERKRTKETYDVLLQKLLNGGNQREVWTTYDRERNQLTGALRTIYEGSSPQSKEYQSTLKGLRPNDIRVLEANYDKILTDNIKPDKTIDWDNVQALQDDYLSRLEKADPQSAQRLANSLNLREQFNYDDAHQLTQLKKDANVALAPYYDLQKQVANGNYGSLAEYESAKDVADQWLTNHPDADMLRWVTSPVEEPTLHSVTAAASAVKNMPDSHIKLANTSLDITEKNLPILQQYDKQVMSLITLPSSFKDDKGREYNPKTRLREIDPLYDALYFWLGYSDSGTVFNLSAVQNYINQWGPRSDGVKPVQRK